MPRRTGLERDLEGEGVVLRSVAVDQPQVEQVVVRRGVAGREIQVMHDELRQVGCARGDVRLGAGAAGAADLVGDLPQDGAAGGPFGIADRREEFARLGGAEEVPGRGGNVDGVWHVGAL